MHPKTPALRIAESCDDVARDIEARRLPLSRLGRDSVFTASGGSCCPFGFAIARAGLQQKLRPFRGEPFNDAVASGARNWDNAKAYADATGVAVETLPQDLVLALQDLEVYNATKVGDDRRVAVVRSLRAVAVAIIAAELVA